MLTPLVAKPPSALPSPLRIPRKHPEAPGVVRLVLDVLDQDVEAVNPGGQPRGNRCRRLVAALGNIACRAGGVAGDDRPDAALTDDAAALPERMDVAPDRLYVRKPGPARRHQLALDRQEPLADDVEAGGRQQMMDIGEAAGERVF